jgi:hypothetical protein
MTGSKLTHTFVMPRLGRNAVQSPAVRKTGGADLLEDARFDFELCDESTNSRMPHCRRVGR